MQSVRPRLTEAQSAALDRAGAAYCAGYLTFKQAVRCRDLIRAGRIDEVDRLLQTKGFGSESRSTELAGVR